MSEVKEILRMCEEVINGENIQDVDCGLLDCGKCPFNDEYDRCGMGLHENYVKIAKQYIEDHKDDEEIINFEVFKLRFNSKLNNFVLDVNMDLLEECNITEEEFRSKFDYDTLNKLTYNISKILKKE